MIECSQKVRSVCPYGETCGGGEYKEGSDCDKFAESLQNKKAHNPGGDPITREQVEKVWPGCQMCKGWNTIELKPCANGDLGVQADIGSSGQTDPFGLVVYNKLLASGYIDFKFCPFCGSPKTDEAVDMVMERLEVLKDGN